eukprot:482801-Hanusia_phi.AAC.1
MPNSECRAWNLRGKQGFESKPTKGGWEDSASLFLSGRWLKTRFGQEGGAGAGARRGLCEEIEGGASEHGSSMESREK